MTEYPESFNYLTPAKTMEVVLEAIQEVIPYELAVILSLETNDILKVRYFRGPLSVKQLEEYEINLNIRQDLKGIITAGEVQLLTDDENHTHLDTYDGIIELPGGHSCMVAPLVLDGEKIGLMTLDHSQCDMFTPGRVSIARTLSRLIALALAQSVKTSRLMNEKETLIYERNSLITDMEKVFKGLIGQSAVWKRVIEQLKLVAPTDSHVMILGETGTGKEQIAKAIHAFSNRSDKPFIALNCSAINAALAESELFGHEKGAFTGAFNARKGRFELADGGILFLDEIGDLPLEIQPKLLRAIQEGSFERVGGEKTIFSDVRIVCATHINLEDRVKEGRFREDLYYRLNIFPIRLPALRERRGDIIMLVNYFLENLALKFGRETIRISEEAVNYLVNREWKGNVRELQNSLERAVIISRGKEIVIQDFGVEEKNDEAGFNSAADITSGTFEEEVKNIIIRVLKQTNGKIYGEDGAARILDIKPTTLQSKIKKYNIRT